MMEVIVVVILLALGVAVFAIVEDKAVKLQEDINNGYKPLAVDGDGDGKVQDGTEWERPAPKKAVKKAVKKTAKKAPVKKKTAKKAPAKKKAAKKKK